MTVAIRQEINLTNITADTVDTVESYYGAGGCFHLDASKYSDATYYIEFIFKNYDISIRTLNLGYKSTGSDYRNSLDGAQNYSLPGNTLDWTLLRISSSFSGDRYYHYYFGTGYDDDVAIKSVKLIILQSAEDITDTQTQIEIGSYMAKASSPSEDVYMGVDEPKYWKYESAKWDPTPTFKFGITVANENAGKANNVGIQEDDGAGGWTATPVITITGISSEDPTYYESSNFTPTNGKIYRLAWMTPNNKYALTIYNAKIIATQVAVDQINDIVIEYGQDNIYGASGTFEAIGQSFTPSITQLVSIISFKLKKLGSPTDNIYLEISDSLNGSVITNGTSDNVAAASLVAQSENPAWVAFNFSTPPTLTGSTKYYCRIFRSGSRDTSNYIQVGISSGNNYSDGGELERNSGTWTEDTSSEDCRFRVHYGEITKLQPEYLLINEAQTDTGLQEFQTYFNPAEWDGVVNDYFHEHSADSASSNTKLQEDPGGTPADITNSNITGNNLTRGGSAMTMPATAKEIDSYIVTA